MLGSTLIKWWHCPKRFIPKSIYDWYKIYNLYKTFPGSFNLNNQRTIFLSAVSVYDSYIKEFNSELAKIRRGAK